MHTFARAVAGAAVLAVTALGTSGAIGTPALADKPDSVPCAKQEHKVAKAEEAMARVTAVFARQKDRVSKMQEKVDGAATPEEAAKWQAKLDRALAKKADAKENKRAQKQRLAKAQARLEACVAANPV